MAQISHYDSVVLEKIKAGEILVDAEKGCVYGRVRHDGDRNKIGHVVGNRYIFSVVIGVKCVGYFVCRAIYLSVHRKIDKDMEVYNIDGDISNSCIGNLSIRKPSRSSAHVKVWTEEEEKLLVDNVNKMPYAELSQRLARSIKAIRHKVKNIGLRKKGYKRLWTPSDDQLLHKLYENGALDIDVIAHRMNKSANSVRLRANRINNLHRSNRHLKDMLNEENFYSAFKLTMQRGTLWSKCCLCDYDKYIHLHHIDGDRSNNRLSNLASLCPNHHTEVGAGDHGNKKMCVIWRRKYSDGSLGQLMKSN